MKEETYFGKRFNIVLICRASSGTYVQVMSKEISLFSLWGAWVIHCQMLLIALLCAILPQGYWWEIAFFLLSLLILGLNIAVNYLWAVFYWFKSEDIMADSILGIVLLAFMTFAAIPMGTGLYQYYYFASAKIQNNSNCPDKMQKKGFFLLKNAHLINHLSMETDFRHYSQTKGHSPTYYSVNYKLTPLACGEEKDAEYCYFIVYHAKGKMIQNFDLQYIATFPTYSKYVESYPSLLVSWEKKYHKKAIKEPVFLELLDLPNVIAEKKFYFGLFYGIIMSIWLSLTLILPFGIYLKIKYVN